MEKSKVKFPLSSTLHYLTVYAKYQSNHDNDSMVILHFGDDYITCNTADVPKAMTMF